MDTSFEALFKRYNEHHPGKHVTGQSLAKMFGDKKRNLALDIGAGDGIITSHLEKCFKRVDAVEKNPVLARTLATRGGGINVINKNFLDCELNDQYDFVLMSYLLDSYDKDQTGEIMQKIRQITSDQSTVTAVSYQKDCDYDKFSKIVCDDLGIERNCGRANIEKRLGANGYECTDQKSFESFIWGSNIDELYKNLSFFYKKNLDGYQKNREKYTKLLGEFMREGDYMPALYVGESIFDIHQK